MYLVQAALAEVLDSETIKTMVQTVLMAEFTLAIGEDPSAFKSDNLIKVHIVFGHCP